MARPRRNDVAGAYYHVGNRAIARRPYFETRADFRFFESRLAYAARREEILVIAFALMTTHFHLLLRSLGGLSEALRRIQNEYTRRFNRLRKRDGPLGRGRFFSKRVDTLEYRCTCLHYIDENPVVARLAEVPEAYEWSSAHLYAQDRRPRWLHTEWVDSMNLGYGGDREGLWTPDQRAWRADLVQARLGHRADQEDPLDDLCARVPGRVWDWMVRKAELADGTRPGLPIVGPALVCSVVEELQSLGESASITLAGTRGRRIADVLQVGLLRDLAGQTWAEIAARVAMHATTVHDTHRLHASAVLTNDRYAQAAVELTERCLYAMRPCVVDEGYAGPAPLIGSLPGGAVERCPSKRV